MSMRIGYARTSTLEQVAGFEAQLAELKRAGCKKVFKEQVSSVDVAAREQLAAAIEFAREGDTFVVTKIDRLARSVKHLLEVVDALKAKGVSLLILDPNIDTGGPFGEMILTILGAIGQFERRIMLERQREGIAKAKGEGKYKGRAPTARAKADQVRHLLADGMKPTEVAKQAGISRRSVYRIIEDAAA